MFKNYLKSAFRNHVKSKWNSLINIFSLAIGIACCILIYVFVSHEFSFDRFHENAENIHQIYYEIITGKNEVHTSALQPHSLVHELHQNYESVIKASSFQRTNALVEFENKKFNEDFAKVDSTFLSIFSFPLIAGNEEKALLSDDQVVITKNIVDKYFENLNDDYSQVIGKTIGIYNWNDTRKDYIVTGVLKPVPKNSSLEFDLLMLKKGNDFYSRSNNIFGELSVFALLNDNYQPVDVKNSLVPLVDKLFGKTLKELRQKGVLKDSDDCFKFKMQPLADVYFNTEIQSRYEKQSNNSYSYILIGIGLLIITLACINFINLSIGQSLHKTLEIGIRKVLGAGKKQIIIQYFIEKSILIILALMSGYMLAELFLPKFNQLAQKELTISMFNNFSVPLFLFSILIISSLFAAGIPSLVLSKVSPNGVFKTISKLGGRNRVNSVLIIVQFFLSIVLLTSAFIMSQQISFMQNKDLGFDKEQIVVIPIMKEYSDIYKNKITAYPEIINATGCDRNFSNGSSTRLFYTKNEKPVEVTIIRVEEEYINTLGIQLLEGRNFSKDFTADEVNSVLVNQTFVDEFDLESPIGESINGYKFREETPKVIGVIKDFHYHSLRSKIPPLMLHMTKEIPGPWGMLVKIKADNIAETISLLEKIWKETVPNRDFNYTFLDDDFNAKYSGEQHWQKITGVSTLFAFIISALGLLGLAMIVTNVRTKEIGIRKVLGASITNVVVILNKDITKWILIANVLALPATWYIMSKWLENYEYHININWWVFIITGFVSLAIALLTVSYQTIRTAIANPVESLRYE
jgi:putative ABC transport system permease protein